MKEWHGKLVEIGLESTREGDRISGQIACPPQAIPAPGQYLVGRLVEGGQAAGQFRAVRQLADHPDGGSLAALGTPLFATRTVPGGFEAAPPLPADWLPGSELALRGPVGQGFSLPDRTCRVALAALGETPARLFFLAGQALERACEVTLVTAPGQPGFNGYRLPVAVEISPAETLVDVVAWADFLAVDLPLSGLPGLRQLLKVHSGERLPIPAQVLVTTPMPCAGLADCGVCAVPGHKRRWRLACKDGPVFDLNDLEW